MNRWPLRWKIAVYAAALGVVATIAGAGTTWIIMHYVEVARFGADSVAANQIGRDIIFGMFGAIPTVLVVVAIGGRWVARRAIAPVHQIQQAAERITAQNLAQRLPLPAASDEIAALVTVLNSTLDRLQGSFEQSVRFSAEASHHLKTPLSILRVGIEEMLTDPTAAPEQQARADALLHQVHQLNSIADDLLLLANADAGRLELKHEDFDLTEVLDGIVDDARALAEPLDISVEVNMPDRLPVKCDRRSIALILQKLVENAVKFNERAGVICIYVEKEKDSIEVRVLNNGNGIPLDRASNIFERFYRARSDGRIPGSGLGLSIARQLARSHGGELELVKSTNEWTEFRLILPVDCQAERSLP